LDKEYTPVQVTPPKRIDPAGSFGAIRRRRLPRPKRITAVEAAKKKVSICTTIRQKTRRTRMKSQVMPKPPRRQQKSKRTNMELPEEKSRPSNHSKGSTGQKPVKDVLKESSIIITIRYD
jgi:hypothetical protein